VVVGVSYSVVVESAGPVHLAMRTSVQASGLAAGFTTQVCQMCGKSTS